MKVLLVPIDVDVDDRVFKFNIIIIEQPRTSLFSEERGAEDAWLLIDL
mgnify:CR=1 FL=1